MYTIHVCMYACMQMNTSYVIRGSAFVNSKRNANFLVDYRIAYTYVNAYTHISLVAWVSRYLMSNFVALVFERDQNSVREKSCGHNSDLFS